MPIKLYTNAPNRFWRIFEYVRREIAIAPATGEGSKWNRSCSRPHPLLGQVRIDIGQPSSAKQSLSLQIFVDWSDSMLTLQVNGMTCNHCVKAVTQAVMEVDPKAEVKVDLPSGRVEVTTSAQAPALAAAVTEAGYEVVSAA